MKLYQGFDGQYVDGSWRPGKPGGVQVEFDPSGATLTETIMANQVDLDEAYHAAAKAAGRTRDGHATFRIEDGYSGFGRVEKAEHGREQRSHSTDSQHRRPEGNGDWMKENTSPAL